MSALTGNLPGKLLVHGAPTNCATPAKAYLLIIALILHMNNRKPIFAKPFKYFKILKYLDLRNILYLVKEKKQSKQRYKEKQNWRLLS